MTAQKFRKKPVVIEAMLYTNDNKYEICQWSGDKVWYGFPDSVGKSAVALGYASASDLWCSTLEGDLRATVGDWIIKGVAGEFYPCKPDIFEQTYESAFVPVLETPHEGMKGHAEVFVADDGERAIKWVSDDALAAPVARAAT